MSIWLVRGHVGQSDPIPHPHGDQPYSDPTPCPLPNIVESKSYRHRYIFCFYRPHYDDSTDVLFRPSHSNVLADEESGQMNVCLLFYRFDSC